VDDDGDKVPETQHFLSDVVATCKSNWFCAKVCNNCPPSQRSLAFILFTSKFCVLLKAWKGLEDFHSAIPSVEADYAIITNTPVCQQWEWHHKFYLRRWCAEAKAQRRPVETLQQIPGAGMPVPAGSVAE